jgi:hypothetical protein
METCRYLTACPTSSITGAMRLDERGGPYKSLLELNKLKGSEPWSVQSTAYRRHDGLRATPIGNHYFILCPLI